MESLPLKELDFGLQKRTGPSSGVVCGSLVIEVQYVKTFFMNFKFFLQTMQNAYFSCSKQTFYIIRMPISYSRSCAIDIFKYTSFYYFFMATKVNRSTKSDFFTNFKKS